MEHPAHPMPTRDSRGQRWIKRRVAKKGLRPRYAAYIVIAFWSVAIVLFGVVERLVDPDSFHSIWAGIWWATQTVTTVGYGDIVPHQVAGRAIAVVLMLGGLSILAVLTGVVTSAFVTRSQEELRESGEDPTVMKLDELARQVAELRTEVSQLERRS